MSYWKICIEEALDEVALAATNEQVEAIAKFIETAHDNHGTAMGYDCIPNPQTSEITKLKEELQKERDKIVCQECKGTGTIHSYGPIHGSISRCDKCRGEGRHSR